MVTETVCVILWTDELGGFLPLLAKRGADNKGKGLHQILSYSVSPINIYTIQNNAGGHEEILQNHCWWFYNLNLFTFWFIEKFQYSE